MKGICIFTDTEVSLENCETSLICLIIVGSIRQTFQSQSSQLRRVQVCGAAKRRRVIPQRAVSYAERPDLSAATALFTVRQWRCGCYLAESPRDPCHTATGSRR